jgi:hypothetical protein
MKLDVASAIPVFRPVPRLLGSLIQLLDVNIAKTFGNAGIALSIPLQGLSEFT